MQVIKKAAIAVIAGAAFFSAQQAFAYTETTAKKVCKKGYHKDDFGSGYSCNKSIVVGTPVAADATAKTGDKKPSNGPAINPTNPSPVSR